MQPSMFCRKNPIRIKDFRAGDLVELTMIGYLGLIVFIDDGMMYWVRGGEIERFGNVTDDTPHFYIKIHQRLRKT